MQCMGLDTLMVIAFFSLFSNSTRRWDLALPLSPWAEAGSDGDGDVSSTSVAECKHGAQIQ